MSDVSPTVMILIAGEMLVLIGLLVVFVYKKYRDLKEVLRSEKNKIKRVKRELNIEKSEKITREKISGYLVGQQELTTKKIAEVTADDDNELKAELLELRNQVLGCELTTLKINNLDDGYWEGLVHGYGALTPRSELTAVVKEKVVKEKVVEENVVEENIVEENVAVVDMDSNELDSFLVSDDADDTGNEQKQAVNLSSVDFSDNAKVQLNRLNGVITNQFATIDELKKQLHDAEAAQADLVDIPFVGELKAQLIKMEKGQVEMTACLSVVESENDRLIALLTKYQDKDRTDEEHTSEIAAEDLPASDHLIDNLTQKNKENLCLISELENEIGELGNKITELKSAQQNIPENTTSDAKGAGMQLQAQLKETEGLVHRLSQTNKEHVQCISILESELDALQEKISEQDAKISQFMLDETAVESKYTENNDPESEGLKLQLDTKMAEFELLQSDYESMKQRYIDLFKQSRAS